MKLNLAYKVLILLFLFIALSSTKSFCQSKKEARQNKIKSASEFCTENINGKLVTRKEAYEEFDKNGNTKLKIDFKKDGSIDKKVASSYNKDNKKIEEIEYTPDGEVFKKTVFTYNTNGDKLTETVYNKAGQILKKNIYKYDSKNLKTEKQTINNIGEKESVKKWSYEYF